MSAYLRYLWYVLKHKWFVFLECCKRGIVLRGITHDLSKLYPSELIPYAQHFYGKGSEERREEARSGKPGDTGNESFEVAWFHHTRRNDHHWQYWVFPPTARTTRSKPMSRKAVIEMICDWEGAARAQSNPWCAREWYLEHSGEMRLHKDTRALVEELLGVKE